MIEYWACIGLACIDKEFLDRVEDPKKMDMKTVGDVVKGYGFRLSKFELAELERVVADPEAEKCMRMIQPVGCRPPVCSPSPAPPVGAGYEKYKEWYRSVFERLREKP